LIEQETVALVGIGGAKNEYVDLVFDQAARVARRLVEPDNGCMLRRIGIELAARRPLDAHIGTGLAEDAPFDERLGRAELQLDQTGVGRARGQNRTDRNRACKRFGHGVGHWRFPDQWSSLAQAYKPLRPPLNRETRAIPPLTAPPLVPVG